MRCYRRVKNSVPNLKTNLSALTVQNQTLQVPTGSALSAIDTGTTLIGGPSAEVAAFWAKVPGSQSADSAGMQGFYTYRESCSLPLIFLQLTERQIHSACDTTLSVSLSFGGKAWPIDPVDMTLGQISARSADCLGGIFDLSMGSSIVSGRGNPAWVVGATFLKNVYSVYRSDPPSVGFAQLSDLAGGSGAPGTGTAGTTTSKKGNGAGRRAADVGMGAAVAMIVGAMLW